MAVLTGGSIQAGTKSNVIPDPAESHLRSYGDTTALSVVESWMVMVRRGE